METDNKLRFIMPSCSRFRKLHLSSITNIEWGSSVFAQKTTSGILIIPSNCDCATVSYSLIVSLHSINKDRIFRPNRISSLDVLKHEDNVTRPALQLLELNYMNSVIYSHTASQRLMVTLSPSTCQNR